MHISISTYNPSTPTDCLILPIYTTDSKNKSASITEKFDQSNNNIISDLIKTKDLTGKYAEIKWLYNVNSNIKRVLAIGIGDPSKLTANSYIDLLTKVMEQVVSIPLNNLSNGLLDVPVPSEYSHYRENNYKSLEWKISQNILVAERFNHTTKNYQQAALPALELENYTLCYSHDENNLGFEKDALVKQNQILAAAIRKSKDLANMPANICNPAYLEQQVKDLCNKFSNLTCTVYEHDQITAMGMGAFSAVSQGSNNPGKMIIIEYNNSKNTEPYVLVGKGITFDTGGYTLKPANSMVGMKFDMSGSASVIATMQAICELELPIKVVGILACAENMIGHKSTRPDDIVTTLKGKTIEINNTDAEGRLVLCDALTFSEKFKPKVVIDIATLTGAAVVALGYHYTAMYTNNKQLEADLITASHKVFDPVWPMPLCRDYDQLMKSPLADLKNSSGVPSGGSITAACFLLNFIPEGCAWAHLDIAGSATVKADHKESTGRPVALLVEYLIAQAKHS